MAKIVVEFDTNDKYLTIKQDGKVLSDIHEISFGCIGEDEDGDELYQMVLRSMVTDEDNAMNQFMTTYASEVNKKMKEYTDKDVTKQVRDFLSAKLKKA